MKHWRHSQGESVCGMADSVQGERDREADTVLKLCNYNKGSPHVKREGDIGASSELELSDNVCLR